MTVLVFGTLEGVLVGVLFSLLVVLHLLDQPFLETLTRDATGSVAVVEDGVALLAPSTAGLRIAHPVYYANQRRVVDAIEEWLDSFEPSPQRLFVDLPAQTESGPAFADFLRHLQRMLATAGTDLIVCGMSAHALEQLHRTQVWAEIEAEVDIFPSIQAAIDGSD